MGDRTLDYIALGVLCFVVLTIIYGVIYIHDIPYEIAKKRKHPHQDAIHTAGWVSLFLVHTIWPFLWIWATLYKPEVGWGLSSSAVPGETSSAPETHNHTTGDGDTDELRKRLAKLEVLQSKQQDIYAKHLKQLNSRIVELENQLQRRGGR